MGIVGIAHKYLPMEESINRTFDERHGIRDKRSGMRALATGVMEM